MATTSTPKKDTALKTEGIAPERTLLTMVSKPGKKVETSYFIFEGCEDLRENRLPKIVATKTANRILKYANAEEILKDQLQAGFVKAAWDGGWTLVEAIKFAADQIAQLKLIPKSKKKGSTAGLHDRAKARLIAMFNPTTPAEDMVDALLAQLTEQKDALTKTLIKYEQELGRREDGSLKFRSKQNLKKQQVNV